MARKKLSLISNARSWWKLWSIRFGALGTALTGFLVMSSDAALFAWNLLPDDLKTHIPQQYIPMIGVFIFAMSMVARLVKQNNLGDSDENVK